MRRGPAGPRTRTTRSAGCRHGHGCECSSKSKYACEYSHKRVFSSLAPCYCFRPLPSAWSDVPLF